MGARNWLKLMMRKSCKCFSAHCPSLEQSLIAMYSSSVYLKTYIIIFDTPHMQEGLEFMGVLPVFSGCSDSWCSIGTDQFKLDQGYIHVFEMSWWNTFPTIFIWNSWYPLTRPFAVVVICFQFGLIVEYRWTISCENDWKSLLLTNFNQVCCWWKRWSTKPIEEFTSP